MTGAHCWLTRRVRRGSRTVLAMVSPCLLALAPAAALAGPVAATAGWAQVGYSAQHTGFNPHEHVLSPRDVEHVGRAWSYRTGGGVFNSPAVAGGVVYASSADGQLYALDAATGARLWSTPGYYSPAVAGGRVYAGCAGGWCAFAAATGALLWSYDNGYYGGSDPTVAGGVVYLGLSGGPLALSAATGAIRWVAGGGDPLIITSSPAVADGMVYTASYDTESGNCSVTANDADTGQPRWDYLVFCNTNGSYSSPAVADGVVYADVGRNVDAFSTATGARLWRHATGGDACSGSCLAVANGVVYAGSADGRIYALDAATGSKLWSYATGGAVSSSPAVANGVVYDGALDGRIYALDAATGEKLWSYATGGQVSSPAVAGGRVYAGSADHSMYAFGLKDTHRA